MAEKTTKKVATKKPVAKKTVSKPAVAKKPVAKKAPAKKVADVKKVAAAPVVEKLPCGCDKGCTCGNDCVCTKKKCTFGRFLKKLIFVLIIFALGFAAAKMCCCDKHGKMGPRPQFENGCLVVKCPKMEKMVPVMDANKDGCVSREEFRAMRKHKKHEHRPEMPAPAPEMAE